MNESVQSKLFNIELFLLVLRVLFNLALDTIYKSGGLPKAFLQKDFKFIPGGRCETVILDLDFTLLLTKKKFVFQKKRAKYYMPLALSSYSFEMDFILLPKVVILHMQDVIV